jgi:hypothetical protein
MDKPRSSPWLARATLAACVVAAVVGIGRGLELAPDATNRLRDDAFYEFAWAANLAAGRGPEVSDGVTTSGVQLLWSLLLVPLAFVGGAASLPLLAPWLGFLLHLATAALWWRRATDRFAGACVALCWLGNPLLVRESQNGQETALACLLASALWLWRRAGERTFVLLGVLAVLARSDLLPLVAALSVWRHGLRASMLWAPGLAFGVHVAGNLLLGGGWLPDSALPMAWLWHANHAAVDAGGGAFWRQSWWFARPVLLGGPWALASAMGLGFAVFVVVRNWWPTRWRALPALAVGCASAIGVHDLATAGWTALLLALLPANRRRPLPRGMVAVLLGLAAIVVLHWAVRWYPRDYYAAPLVVAAAAAMMRHGRVRLLLALWAAAQVADAGRVEPEPLGGQQEMEMAGRFLAEVVPAGERVGCFNSGLVTFFAAVTAPTAARRAIVNLDGVVDGRSFAALREARMSAWLDQQGIGFVLDNPVQFALDPRLPHACGRWFGPDFDPPRDLVEIARFDVPAVDAGRPATDGMRLYWRRGRGPVPTPVADCRDLGAAPDGGRFVLWPAVPGRPLEAEQPDGSRREVAVVDVATTAVVAIARERLGTGRLFVRGGREPVLTLPKL